MITNIIQALADEKGVTIAQMLKDLHLGQGTFSTWKKRGTTPSGEHLSKIADYFGVTVDYLLGKAAKPEEPATESDRLDNELLSFIHSLNPAQYQKFLDFLQHLKDSSEN